jgi:regulator of sirC expression with transglutaminase-like and TPR domain
MTELKYIPPPEDDAQSPGAKSLAPLIAVFTLIILLTIVLINLDFGKGPEKGDSGADSSENVIELGGGSGNTIQKSFVRNTAPPPRGSDVPNRGEMLAHVKKLLAEHKTKLAEDELKTLLVFDPDNSVALTLLGGIYYYSGRERDAEYIFRRQIKLAPQDHQAYNHLGSALAKQKHYREAIESVATAIGLKPDSGEAQINLAGIYAITNNRKAALEHFEKAAKLLGTAILPLSRDRVFDNIRQSRVFQTVISDMLRKRTGNRRGSESGRTDATTFPDGK